MTRSFYTAMTRRHFLSTSAAALASAVPSGAPAQGARFRRWEISDPGMPPRVLDSYKKGIREMLNRPATDPRNWYRNAFIHVFDCPHQNRWFLAWHRAYIGWLEATIREFSGDPEFALPYWDWTETPRVPAAMFDDVRSQQRCLHPYLPAIQRAVRCACDRSFRDVLSGAEGRAGATGPEQHSRFLERRGRRSGGDVF